MQWMIYLKRKIRTHNVGIDDYSLPPVELRHHVVHLLKKKEYYCTLAHGLFVQGQKKTNEPS
jgi:hypothetical protein